ncbi:ATP-binding protein [Streptomyces sp. NPDC091281]|uniref:ATP-binding protein n=1 Tax=Streptomyces sp. NPDC091281 TaxID=3365985 RepID=UPI003819AF34
MRAHPPTDRADRATEPTTRPTGPAERPDSPGVEDLPCRPADVRVAVRQAVAGYRAAGPPCDERSVADALLVASELATNAILHGGGLTAFGADLDGRAVRVSVSDRSDLLPVAPPPGDAQHRGRFLVGGRGWPLVCRLAREVRVRCLPTGGKTITALVPLT